MDTKGGRFELTMNGQVFSGRAAAKLMLAGVAVEAGVNQDGTDYATVQPKLVGLDLTFDRGRSDSIRWDTTMLLKSWDVTFKETDVGRTHLFTGAKIVGEPVLDTATGEVSGLTLRTGARNYRSY